MTYDEAMKSLESNGSAQTRKTNARHGITGEMFGVSYAHFGKLTKQIKVDHALAVQLWESGNYDARILATMIADPAKIDAKLLERWSKACDSYAISAAVSRIGAKSPVRAVVGEKWMDSDREFVATAGWSMHASAAGAELTDAECAKTLKRIESEIADAKNFVKYAMNQTLICIGGRGGAMKDKAIAAAKRIGKVEVDHGDTSCKTPDAIPYIEKMVARKNK